MQTTVSIHSSACISAEIRWFFTKVLSIKKLEQSVSRTLRTISSLEKSDLFKCLDIGFIPLPFLHISASIAPRKSYQFYKIWHFETYTKYLFYQLTACIIVVLYIIHLFQNPETRYSSQTVCKMHRYILNLDLDYSLCYNTTSDKIHILVLKITLIQHCIIHALFNNCRN